MDVRGERGIAAVMLLSGGRSGIQCEVVGNRKACPLLRREAAIMLFSLLVFPY